VRLIREKGLNRVVVAACSPKTHEPIFRRVLMRAGLNPFLLEMVNLSNQDSWVHRDYREEATIKAMDMVRMGVDKARLLEPLEIGRTPVVRRALVVGGGIAGMTAAINLARQGYETHLVEKERHLGGLLRRLREVAPAGLDAHALLETKERELAEAGVHVHLGTEVEVISGHVGKVHARLSSGEKLDVGAVILATGAVPYQPTQFGYGHIPQVVTNLELETMDEVPGQRVTFVACVGSRTDTRGCSRYCCQSMMAQALRLRRQGEKVRILYKDIRTFSRQAEELYEEAMRAGVQFIRYDPEKSPEEVILFRDGEVMVHDTLLGETLRVPTALLVLVVGLNPVENPVAQPLKVPQSEHGFLLELHPKLGPAEAPFPGIYLAGTCQVAKDVREAVAQGLAAAAKAGRILAKETIEKDPVTARLIEDRCIYCGRCVPVCPFGAMEMLGAPLSRVPCASLRQPARGAGPAPPSATSMPS
jgi:heterodisulfide reductase subunit A